MLHLSFLILKLTFSTMYLHRQNTSMLLQILSSDCFLQQIIFLWCCEYKQCTRKGTNKNYKIWRKLLLLECLLKKKCSQQMWSQCFIEYFWTLTFKTPTPTLLEALQALRNHCIDPFWFVTIRRSGCSTTAKAGKQLETAVQSIL